jgi:hypothetical protein
VIDRRNGNNPDIIHSKIMRARFNKLKQTKEFQQWRYVQYYSIQKKNCAWCREFMRPDFVGMHVDHALALYHGGRNNFDNQRNHKRRQKVWLEQ